MEAQPLHAPFLAPRSQANSPATKSRLKFTAQVLLALHVVAVVFLLLLLHLSPAPLHTDLIRWDAVWYDAIRLQGYTYHAEIMSSTAFFPLFPFVWRMSGLDALGICLLNLAVFAGALTLLYKQLRLRPVAVLLFTAFPSSLFFYMPYTEALFFMASSLVLVGLARQSSQTLFGGMLMGAFARVTSFFYLPAFFVVEALQAYLDPKTFGVRFKRMFLYGSLTGLGLALVMLIHWSHTGVWFAFNKTQGHWDHHLRFPSFPLITNTSTIIAWLDGVALLVGILAGVWVVRTIVRVVRRQAEPPKATVLFSAVFVSVTALYTLAYAPLIREVGSSNLMSMHRYVFGTPFFLVLINEFIPRKQWSARRVLLGLVPVVALALALGFLNLEPVALYMMRKPIIIPGLLYTAFIATYAYFWMQTGTRWGRALVYTTSILLQFLYCYLQTVGVWIA